MERAWVVFSRRLGLWRLGILLDAWNRLGRIGVILERPGSVMDRLWSFFGTSLDILKLPWSVLKASRVV